MFDIANILVLKQKIFLLDETHLRTVAFNPNELFLCIDNTTYGSCCALLHLKSKKVYLFFISGEIVFEKIG